MRIVHIITRSDMVGGAQVHVRDLSMGLQSRKFKVFVATGGTGPFLDKLKKSGINYRVLNHLTRQIRPWKDYRAYLELRNLFDRLKPDLVTVHSSKAGWIGRFAARSMRLPVVFTAHGWLFTEGAGTASATVWRWAERIAAPMADRIITVSEYGRKLAIDRGVAPAGKLVTVYNGIPAIGQRERANPAIQPPRLVMTARFERPKDHQTLLNALQLLKRRDWTIDLIGDGPLRFKIQKLVEELGLRNRVRFLGICSEIIPRVATAQIFLLISLWEGFPLSILEAMRAGLPVIASDVGGIREAVVEGETGFLVPRGDAGILAEKIDTLIKNPGLRLLMGSAGRKRYRELFTLDKMVEQTIAVYREAIELNNRRRLSSARR